jgi:hypothetical protein
MKVLCEDNLTDILHIPPLVIWRGIVSLGVEFYWAATGEI